MSKLNSISSNLNYSKNSLLEGEQIIAAAKWSPFIYAIPILVLLFGLFMLFFDVSFEGGATISVVFFILLLLLVRISCYYSEFVITNKRVIVKAGIIIRSAFELKNEMLESVSVYQGIFGRIFKFGTIRICGVGASRCVIHFIDHPLEFRQKFYEEVYYKVKPVDSQDENIDI